MTPDTVRNHPARFRHFNATLLIVLVGCVIVVLEMRKNHLWYRMKIGNIEEIRDHEFYHPMMNVEENYRFYGKAVQMMLADPATSFWFIMKDNTLYAPVVINHYLYPGHQIRMAEETQRDVIRYWLYGIEATIRQRKPTRYDKAIEASYHYTRFPDEATDAVEEMEND